MFINRCTRKSYKRGIALETLKTKIPYRTPLELSLRGYFIDDDIYTNQDLVRPRTIASSTEFISIRNVVSSFS